MAAVAQRIGQALLHGGQLHAEAVELLVLRARGVTLLPQHRLLEQANGLAQRLRQLLARATGAALQFFAQLAFELGLPTIGVGLEVLRESGERGIG